MSKFDTIGYPGPPGATSGFHNLNDIVVDSAGVVWTCTKGGTGSAATWVSETSSLDKVGAAQADVSFGGHKATLLGNAVASTDALPLGQAQGLFEPFNGASGRLLTSGEETYSRLLGMTNNSPVGGTVVFSYFTARKTETVNNIRTGTSTTPAGATPTLCRMGLYSVAANGDLTLVGACANDTTLWGTANTWYTRALTAGVAKVEGSVYALAALVISSATKPSLQSLTLNAGSSVEIALAPRLNGGLASQTDLPATVPNGNVVTSTLMLYGAVTHVTDEIVLDPTPIEVTTTVVSDNGDIQVEDVTSDGVQIGTNVSYIGDDG